MRSSIVWVATWIAPQTPVECYSCCNKWALLTVFFIGKDKTRWDKIKCSTHVESRWQNILEKLLGVIVQARNATKHGTVSLYVDDILDNIVQQYILIIKPYFSSNSDARLTDKIQIKAYNVIPFLAEHSGVTRRVWENCRVLAETALENFA